MTPHSCSSVLASASREAAGQGQRRPFFHREGDDSMNWTTPATLGGSRKPVVTKQAQATTCQVGCLPGLLGVLVKAQEAQRLPFSSLRAAQF